MPETRNMEKLQSYLSNKLETEFTWECKNILFQELPHIQLTHAIRVDIPHRIDLCFLNAQFCEF